MARVTGYDVTVYRPVIAAQFRGGGQAYDWASDRTEEIERLATLTAPSRSGELKRAHSRSVTSTGLYETTGVIRNRSGHAVYVHQGTRTPIVPRRPGGKMRLPAGNGYPVIYTRKVRGQRAQSWLRNAAQAVLSRYGVVIPR